MARSAEAECWHRTARILASKQAGWLRVRGENDGSRVVLKRLIIFWSFENRRKGPGQGGLSRVMGAWAGHVRNCTRGTQSTIFCRSHEDCPESSGNPAQDFTPVDIVVVRLVRSLAF
jgi:hypothetical protein